MYMMVQPQGQTKAQKKDAARQTRKTRPALPDDALLGPLPADTCAAMALVPALDGWASPVVQRAACAWRCARLADAPRCSPLAAPFSTEHARLAEAAYRAAIGTSGEARRVSQAGACSLVEPCPRSQVFVCFAQSVASTRFMIQDELRLETTPCDNCIIGTMIALQVRRVYAHRCCSLLPTHRTEAQHTYDPACHREQPLCVCVCSTSRVSSTSWRVLLAVTNSTKSQT